MKLEDALKQIQADEAKKGKFYNDPKGTLENMGVDTSSLKISKTSKAETGALRASVCVSIGEFVGVSVGS